MTDFAISWNLCRGRFVDSVSGLTNEQLNYRLHPETLTIGEMALHVAGTELWFVSQLTKRENDAYESKLIKAATDSVVNDLPFPYSREEVNEVAIIEAFDYVAKIVQPHIENPSDEFLTTEIQSVLGPIITGQGALARFAFHPGYHQGQVHIIKTAPGYPA